MNIDFLFRFNRPKKKTAFTIVEVIIAIIVLTIAMVALFSSLYSGFNLVNDVREIIIVSSIIQEEIEELRKSFFVNLPPYGESAFSNDSLSSLYNASGTVKIDEYIDANIVRVAVVVTWYSRLQTDKQKTKRAVTLITRNGINSI